jgi:hypothetical protein
MKAFDAWQGIFQLVFAALRRRECRPFAIDAPALISGCRQRYYSKAFRASFLRLQLSSQRSVEPKTNPRSYLLVL